MLQLMRQLRRRLAGTFGLLLTGAWLALAMAPCATAAESAMEAHCPHCDVVESPCADALPDCELPVSLAPAETDAFKVLKLCAPVDVPGYRDLAPPEKPTPLVQRTVDPPRPPFTALFCRLQE
ncbi:MAG: hypothetical protein KY410_02040 [Proteobacteria bacterium]|nr:hypothetical protein [Pseudomonadota bacterium]